MKERIDDIPGPIFDEDGYEDTPPDVAAALERSIDITHLFPPPEMLVLKTEKQKVTMMLDKEIIDFFKQAAKENGVKYQTMINNLLDAYVKSHSKTS